MPITFRCQACRNKLSTAKRKAGTTVTCPSCGAEVRVPTAADKLDPQVERLLATAAAGADQQAPTSASPNLQDDDPTHDFGPRADAPPPSSSAPPTKVVKVKRPKTSPTPSPQSDKLNDLPLFEREDFAEMLDQETEDSGEEPLPLPQDTASPTTPADGFIVTRSTAVMVMVAVVVLLALAFTAGFLVGNRG